ncbi:sodium-coupled monocarboxylate transporter 1-like [Armigeres subalbatus]|uniref:sodium-coupled monocarboxylate transporter 1-like n=1 Tax=Armigeres subalbatus TaxID=124917 RepID=UPI002ED57999
MIGEYVTFVVFVVTTVLIPLWGRFFGSKEKTKAEYVFGMGTISVGAMMLSIARGTLGVRSLIGYPSELFYRGSAMWETLYGMVTAYPIVCYVFIPVYFNLGITSVYQYLDLRFNSRLVRCLASGTYVVRALLNLGVTLYTPAVALNTVAGVPHWASLLLITVITISFILLGGLKAAITADVIQGITMIVIMIAIIAQSMFSAWSVEKILTVPIEQDRLTFFNFTGDFTVRVDTTSAWLGQLFMSLSIFGCQQSFVQRYLSMGSFQEIQHTLMINIPIIIILFTLVWTVGMGIFSVYAECDPLMAGFINKIDEIVGFFVQDKFSYLPGFLGLFMGSLLNGALTLNVSNINAAAIVTWEDFLAPLPYFKDTRDKKQLHMIRLIGAVYGVIVLGIAFSVGFLSGVIEGSMLMTSATSGPLLGVFLLAMLVPVANWKGAASGMIISHMVTLWITFGGLTIDKETPLLPTSVEGCSNESFSNRIGQLSDTWFASSVGTTDGFQDVFNHNGTNQSRQFPENIYAISYMYYSLIGTFITMMVGTMVSVLTDNPEEDAYDQRLLFSPVYELSRAWPGEERHYVYNPKIKAKSIEKSGTEFNGAYSEKPERKV